MDTSPFVEQPGTGIPQHAKLVFKGVLFEIWQWEQKMFDGTTAIYEKMRRPDTVEVMAITKAGKIIVEDQEQSGRAKKFMSLPGGRADGGAEPLEEIKRELLEETGFAAGEWELLKIVQPFMDNDYRVHLFIARNAEKIAEPRPDAGEKIDIKLYTFDELLALPDNPSFRSRELANILDHVRFDPARREEFRKRLFGGENIP